MTAVVLARNYGDAMKAAHILNLGASWVYPHSAQLVQGLIVTRLVYVQGWMQSDLPAAVVRRITEDWEGVPTSSLDLAWPTTERRPIPIRASAPISTAPPTGPEPVVRRQRRVWPPWLVVLVVAPIWSALGALAVTVARAFGWIP